MPISFDVTRRALTLGSRDATTGWRAVTHSTSTIEMVILRRGSQYLHMLPGVYARTEAVGVTADAVSEGDQIMDAQNEYWHVAAIRNHYLGDSFSHRECDLVKLPMFQASPGTATWSLTRPHDARRQTKVFIDTYARAAQITKDNDSTQASFAVIWNNPPYPVESEFRAASGPVQGLYVVDHPNSTPMLDLDQTPWGYEEHVPIHVITVDSTACTGTILAWKMEAELRYLAETYPTGSQRGLERRGKRDRPLGSMYLYDNEFVLNYRRNTT